MKKDSFTTDVIFRVDTTPEAKGTVLAVFPHNVCTHSGLVSYYAHVGQHSGGDYHRIITTSRPALKAEYQDLKKELESLNYNLVIRKKKNHAKYIESYRKLTR